MKKFIKRQEVLKFQCACHWCKHGKAPDLEAYDEFEKLNKEREKLAMQRGLYCHFFFSWPFKIKFKCAQYFEAGCHPKKKVTSF